MRDINLIPREYENQRNKTRNMILLSAALVMVTAVLITIYAIPMRNIKRLEAEIKNYDDVVIEYNILKGKLTQMQDNEALIEKRLGILEKINENEVKPTEIIEKIKSTIPKDVWLISINYTSSDVSLTGVSNSAVGITEFFTDLRKTEGFNDVVLSPISKDEKGYNFTIQFSLNTGSDSDAKVKAK
ncbi:MAG: PilN domain-containing protein [Caulobacteraceae bacterium]